MGDHTIPTKRRSQSQGSIERARKARKNRNNVIIVVSIVSFLIGYYLLNYVASMEKPPMGATFNIVLGCSIMAITTMVFVFTVKKQYFPKKRKRTKHVFLDDTDFRKSHEVETE
ncbi:MAG: hypothetical protein IPP30_06980 [Flavobacterium sp.]|nr:hypothetical protein [Flavobacterium sp.]